MASCFSQGESVGGQLPKITAFARVVNGTGVLLFQSQHYRVGYTISVGVRGTVTGSYIIGNEQGRELFPSISAFLNEFGLDIERFVYVSRELLNAEMLKAVVQEAQKTPE
jgi:hypothetical protein